MADLQFDFEKHEYKVDGMVYPSVTQLLTAYGLQDFSHVPPDRLEYKRILGTAVHLACQYYDEKCLDEDSLAPEIKPHLLAYKKFCEVTKFEPTHIELKMYSKKYRFAGTVDRQGLFYWKGKEVESIIDLKTTWEMYPSNSCQLWGYQILFEETFPDIKIKHRFGLQLNPNSNYEIVEYPDIADRNTFLACVVLYHWKQKYGLKKEVEKEMGISTI